MLALLRVAAILVALAVVGFAVAYLRTGNRRFLAQARRTLMGGLIAALVFFAVMFVQRLY
jgi:hypothetical protein